MTTATTPYPEFLTGAKLFELLRLAFAAGFKSEYGPCPGALVVTVRPSWSDDPDGVQVTYLPDSGPGGPAAFSVVTYDTEYLLDLTLIS